jgi:hypothetical protein
MFDRFKLPEGVTRFRVLPPTVMQSPFEYRFEDAVARWPCTGPLTCPLCLMEAEHKLDERLQQLWEDDGGTISMR